MIKHIITASILLLVFSLGARATFGDATSLFRSWLAPPHRLIRALASMYVVVPVTAACMGLMFELSVPVRIGLLAIAVAPIPPILPGKQLKGGGSREHVFGLLVAVSLCSVVLVPAVVALLGQVFGVEASFGPLQVARLIGITILLPLLAGLTLRRFAPRWAPSVATWASRLGTVVLAACVVLVLYKARHVMGALVGGGSMLAIVVLAIIAIAAGHWLGGPQPEERSDLAIASAMRHPGIAIAVAAANDPGEPRVAAVILLYVLVATILTSLYVAATTKRRPAPAQ
ncbi:MAG TPA: hypothetical protein VEP93_09505 [Variovorax sp.]|nr:hypothetical protein [Variovorax sp.]